MSINSFEQVNQEIYQELAELNTDDLSSVVGGCNPNHPHPPHVIPHPHPHIPKPHPGIHLKPCTHLPYDAK